VKPRILIAGGGTGGHLFPALAVADELRKRGAEVMFAGTQSGIEARVIPQRDYPIRYLWLSGFNRRRILSNLLFPFKVLTSLLQSIQIIISFKPQAALGTGGYVCGPVLLVAALMGTPLILQEQNSFPGITTRLLSRLAKIVFLNFKEAASYLRDGIEWRHAGNPVRVGFDEVDREKAVARWGLNQNLPTILVFGGSQGAVSINRAIEENLPQLSERCNLIWSRGYIDKSDTSAWQGPGTLIMKPFIDDMPSAYAASDLAVCRSGAMTLSELQAAKLPAILVPYPFAAGDHQRHNAEVFCKYGGSVMIDNKDLTGERLFAEITKLLDDKDKVEKMRHALSELPEQNAAAAIADELIIAAG